MLLQECLMMRLDLSNLAPKVILTKSGNKTYSLNVAYSNEKVLIVNTKDKHSNARYQKQITVPESCICLWYNWPAGRNQSQEINTGIRYNFFIAPQYLILDRLTMNALGLLQAEMTKGTKRKSNLSFTNSEPNLINIIIAFFKRFGVSENDWSWSIVFNFKLKRNETDNGTIMREKQAKEYWLRYTDISLNKRRNKVFQYTGNRKYKNMRKNTIRYGSLRIDVSNIILYQLIIELVSKIKEIITLETAKYYLQGIIAGEGSVKPTRFGSIDNVNIGAINREDQVFYAKCLEMLGINSSYEKNCVRIHNLRNQIKIYKHDLLELHPIRQAKFVKHFVKFRQIPDELKREYYSLREEIENEQVHNVV